MADSCIADGCRKPSEKDRKYCHGHRKREKQRKPLDELREYGTDPGDYLAAKALQYADANGRDSDEAAYRRAFRLLKFAAKQYAAKCQKVPKTPNTAK